MLAIAPLSFRKASCPNGDEMRTSSEWPPMRRTNSLASASGTSKSSLMATTVVAAAIVSGSHR